MPSRRPKLSADDATDAVQLLSVEDDAGHGFITLQEAALQHAASGRTTFEEVLRVTQVDAPEPV